MKRSTRRHLILVSASASVVSLFASPGRAGLAINWLGDDYTGTGSWASNTTYVASVLGRVILLDSYINRPELPTTPIDRRRTPILPQDFIDARPEAIFLGHGHGDHADNAAYVAKWTGATIYASSETCDAMQVDVQREATPIVALAYLEAWEATGDRKFLEYAQAAAHALVKGQLCSGGWDYSIEFDPAKRPEYQYRSDRNCGADKRGVTNLDDNTTQGATRVMMRVDKALKFSDPAVHEATLYVLDKLAAEVGVLVGERSPMPPSAGTQSAERIPGAWSRVEPGAGHLVWHEAPGCLLAAMDRLVDAAEQIG